MAVGGLLALSLSVVAASLSPEPVDQEGIAFFESKIRPVFADNCFRCHGESRQRAELRLDSVGGIRAGGERGTLFAFDEPETSLLLRAISYEDEELEMPPRGKLADDVIEDIRHWVERGAPMPEPAEGAETSDGGEFDLAERAAEWTYQPLAQVEPPEVRDAGWLLQPVDAFVLARLEALGLAPASDAERHTWLRRVTFDLTGLPPTREEMHAFLGDKAPGAHERVVDRLLASPSFGERWGRHWLDLTRYADTRGHEFDFPLPNAYEYRDYVIRALNADVPYDRFLREHIAGDLLPEPRPHPEQGFDESPLATGFWFFGDEVHSPVDTRADELDRLAGKIDTVSKAFLGLTVACARCHDHKFDAITTEDYYALLGYPLSASYRQVRYETVEHNARVAEELERWNGEQGPVAVEVLAEAQPERASGTADYLLGARDVLRISTWATGHVARERDLDARRLGEWVRALQRASEDEGDPLHAFAVLADVGDPQAHLIDLVLRGLEPDGAEAASETIVDYADAATPLIQNGFVYGHRSAGTVRLGGEEPLTEVTPRDAVYYETAWNVLEPHPDSEGEPGWVNWPQAGLMLRTPTFTLGAPRLAYLVRGAGHAYASVDSHRMIHPPLHGALVRHFEDEDAFRWVVHDLSDYVGHRLHVELTADKESGVGFAVAAVVALTDAPPEVVDDARGWLVSRLREASSLEELASRYETILQESLNAFAAPGGPGLARVANWILARPELLAPAVLTPQQEEHVALLQEQRTALLDRIRPVSRLAPAMLEGTGVDEHVLIRGSHHSPGDLAQRRFLEVFAGSVPLDTQGSGRLELAERIAQSPLAWRVVVNRVWHHLFGRGIVASVDDFGRMGMAPTHPDLLDDLARRFATEHDFRIKGLIREIVLSRTYRMSSDASASSVERDPDNLYLHHMPVRRLSAEAIRDAILALSGTLDTAGGGPSVPLHLTDFMEGRGRPPVSGPLDGGGKRSVYLSVRRNFPMPFFAVFDFPAPAAPMGKRSVSNVPAQALTMMNDPFVWLEARRWANRALASSEEPSERIHMLYEEAYSRAPETQEVAGMLAFLDEQGELYAPALRERLGLRDLCHVLLNTKEFLFVR